MYDSQDFLKVVWSNWDLVSEGCSHFVNNYQYFQLFPKPISCDGKQKQIHIFYPCIIGTKYYTCKIGWLCGKKKIASCLVDRLRSEFKPNFEWLYLFITVIRAKQTNNNSTHNSQHSWCTLHSPRCVCHLERGPIMPWQVRTCHLAKMH